MFYVRAVVIRTSNDFSFSDPSDDVVCLPMKLVKLLRLLQSTATQRHQLLKISEIVLRHLLLLLNIFAVEVSSCHETSTQSRQFTDVMMKVVDVQFQSIEFLEKSLIYSMNKITNN